eukprot:GFKZ01011421.1.p1 GENE.GFKZ01011421.1~~GFKZ01011421.1.p1  ORF type:complete len:462 (+),score=70.50 GFKZ01011421.1:299-1684(+)
MDSSKLSATTRKLTTVPPSGDPSHTVWVSFTGYAGPSGVPRGSVVFEFNADSAKREFSRVVHATSSGKFRSPIECALLVGEENNFTLHRLETPLARSLKIDDVSFNYVRAGASIIHFSLDSLSLSKLLADTKEGRVTQTVSSSEGYSVTYEALDAPPSMADEEEIIVISSPPAEETGEGSESYQSVSAICGTSKSSWSEAATDGSIASHKPMKVRFDKEIHLIPSTQQLQAEIQQAVEERSKLSQCVGDLSFQLFQMKHEMRDIKEALKHVTDMFATQSQKLELQGEAPTVGSKSKRRRVVLDGNGIAKMYGRGNFKFEGIDIALRHYLNMDVTAIAVIPESKAQEILDSDRNGKFSHDRDCLKYFLERNLLSLIPTNKKRMLFIAKYALDRNADIVSNDSFRSVVESQSSKSEQRRLKIFLEEHRVPFSFVEDHFIPNPPASELSSNSHSPLHIERSDTL